MKTIQRCVPGLVLVMLLAGCVNHDHQNVELLGGATEYNIQLHSVRDAARPNEKEIADAKGSTGANAVAALRQRGGKPAGSSNP